MESASAEAIAAERETSPASAGVSERSAGKGVGELGQGPVHAVGDAHVAVLEFLVLVRDTHRAELLHEGPRPQLEVELVVLSAVQEEETKPPERLGVAIDHEKRIPCKPKLPDALDQLARREIEREIAPGRRRLHVR